MMKPTPLRNAWRLWPLRALLVSLILAGGVPAGAQTEQKLDKKVRQYLSFEKLPERPRSLIISAIDYYDNGEHQQSIKALMSLLTDKGMYEPDPSLRAWSNQWLALNYYAVDSLEYVKTHVKSSLQEDVDLWHENILDTRLPQDVRRLYEECWSEILNHLINKRESFRVGLGPITRVDFSYRYGLFDFVVGIGTPIILKIKGEVDKSSIQSFDQLLLFARAQRMRKNIERLSPGFYGEFSLLEDLEKRGVKFAGAISGGPILSYTWQSGWEIGGSFEVARLVIGSGIKTKLSQTAFSKDLNLSYSVFEFYFRKWF